MTPTTLGQQVARGVAGEEGVDVFDDAHTHRLAGFLGCAAEMRQQHDILHFKQFGSYRGFLFEHIESRTGNLAVLQGRH